MGLTLTKSKYTRFKHPTLHTSTLFAWIEVDIDFMETVVPEAAPNSKTRLLIEQEPVVEIDEDGNEYTYTPPPVPATEEVEDENGEIVVVPVYRQLKLKEYVPYVTSNDGTKAVFRLSAWDAPTYRKRGIQDKGMELWEHYLTAYGKDFNTVMNYSEHKELMASDEYVNEYKV